MNWVISLGMKHWGKEHFLEGFLMIGEMPLGKNITDDIEKAKQFKTKKDATAYLRTIYSRISWDEYQIRRMD
jgi:hypothetical protein